MNEIAETKNENKSDEVKARIRKLHVLWVQRKPLFFLQSDVRSWRGFSFMYMHEVFSVENK